MHISDRASGVFLAGLGVVSAYAGSRLPPVPGQQVGPNVFPLVVGVGLLVCGALIALGVGRTFEDEAEAELAAITEAVPEPPRGRLFGLRTLIPPALLLVYAGFVEQIGFILTAAAMTLVLSRALGASWRLAVGVAVCAPPLVHLAFYKLLRVPLAPGLLPMPW